MQRITRPGNLDDMETTSVWRDSASLLRYAYLYIGRLLHTEMRCSSQVITSVSPNTNDGDDAEDRAFICVSVLSLSYFLLLVISSFSDQFMLRAVCATYNGTYETL